MALLLAELTSYMVIRLSAVEETNRYAMNVLVAALSVRKPAGLGRSATYLVRLSIEPV